MLRWYSSDGHPSLGSRGHGRSLSTSHVTPSLSRRGALTTRHLGLGAGQYSFGHWDTLCSVEPLVWLAVWNRWAQFGYSFLVIVDSLYDWGPGDIYRTCAPLGDVATQHRWILGLRAEATVGEGPL